MSKEDCPFTVFAGNQILAEIYQFCSMAVEKQEREEELQSAGPSPVGMGKGRGASRKRGPKKVEYYVSIEKFNWACKLYNVPQPKYMEALEWVSFFSQKATEAPKIAIQEIRKDRWSK